MNNPDESWDFFVTKFSKSLRNSVKILIQDFKMVFTGSRKTLFQYILYI